MDTNTRTLDRREFTLEAVLGLLSGVAITISGCGGGGYSGGSSPSGPSPAGSAGSSADVNGLVSNNHGHIAIIRGAQLSAGNAVNLDIQGTADHLHMVDLTADEIHAIASGQRVAKLSSSTQGHDHTVTFAQGSGPSGPGY